ncbi:hypothetical protein LWI29_017887 [Acer saccharum]|uniref:Uncharacterized protein n=1 Tax=Acer saccharum TaxID=4024 RepID=A0AA39RZ48_ACESA|nr:hypothetical protein LWI29_017887 [Acer saccharum]
MAESGKEPNQEMEAVQEVERVRGGGGDQEHSLEHSDTAFLYELNLLTVLLPLFSKSCTEEYFNFGEGEKHVEEIQARACESRSQTRKKETNEVKFAERRASKVHAIKDFRNVIKRRSFFMLYTDIAEECNKAAAGKKTNNTNQQRQETSIGAHQILKTDDVLAPFRHFVILERKCTVFL